ncbi:hypothetical protein [uncultured Tenacibaculum sp.]|uniref:hypothetical protein n=1 Tax=uncultured Tenacibaculum sp. TaxID=174713 RepID=UPI00262FE146|nr:hypothetical protein [uncultured Tenacibaculum sp.]
MKKIVLINLISLLLLSCGAVNRTVFGATEKTLIKTVSIEQNCPKENIKVVDENKGLHGATYALDVCGKRMVYKQVGSVFMEATKMDETIKKGSK